MWTGGGRGDYCEDCDAFVFNLENKYTPNNTSRAIFNYSEGGIEFGNEILKVISNPINGYNNGYCYTGKSNYYDIEGAVSPLTGEKDRFTVSALEVYKVIY